MSERLSHAVKHARKMSRLRAARRLGANDAYCGSVYFISCGEFVKIGIAFNVRSRIVQLQTGNPQRLEVLRVFDSSDPGHDEDVLHTRYARWRTSGEWFRIPQAEIDWIKRRPSLQQLLEYAPDTHEKRGK